MSQNEQPGEETLPTVILVHFDQDKDHMLKLAKHLSNMQCKVERWCPSEINTYDYDLLHNLNNNGQVLLVLPEFHSWYDETDDWSKAEYFSLLNIRPDLRRVILSPCPQDFNSEQIPEWMIEMRESLEIVKYETEKCCLENCLNVLMLHPDSLPNPSNENDWDYIWRLAPDHVYEKLAQMILRLATSPEAKLENRVLESSQLDKVCTSLFVWINPYDAVIVQPHVGAGKQDSKASFSEVKVGFPHPRPVSVSCPENVATNCKCPPPPLSLKPYDERVKL